MDDEGRDERPAAADDGKTVEEHDTQRALTEERAESRRLADLWAYGSTPIPDQTLPQKSASIRNQRPDADDPSSFAVVPTVQLVLRNDPRWGQSVYLVIEDGRFECGQPCAFDIRFGEGEPQRFVGEVSSTGTRPALFIEDDAGFIRALEGAELLEIKPVKGRDAPIRFEASGFLLPRYEAGA
jgi:hypothetical protein